MAAIKSCSAWAFHVFLVASILGCHVAEARQLLHLSGHGQAVHLDGVKDVAMPEQNGINAGRSLLQRRRSGGGVGRGVAAGVVGGAVVGTLVGSQLGGHYPYNRNGRYYNDCNEDPLGCERRNACGTGCIAGAAVAAAVALLLLTCCLVFCCRRMKQRQAVASAGPAPPYGAEPAKGYPSGPAGPDGYPAQGAYGAYPAPGGYNPETAYAQGYPGGGQYPANQNGISMQQLPTDPTPDGAYRK